MSVLELGLAEFIGHVGKAIREHEHEKDVARQSG